MTARIEGTPGGMEVDVKRFYVPGVTVFSTCPECGYEVERDLSHEYLSHPVVGEPEAVYFYCEGGDREESHEVAEWHEDVILGLTLNAVGFEGITEEAKETARRLIGEPLEHPEDYRDQFMVGAAAESRRVHGRIDRGDTGPNFEHSVEIQKVTIEQVGAKPKMPSGTTLAQAIEEHWIEKEIKDFTADQLWTAVKAVQEAIEGEPDGDD